MQFINILVLMHVFHKLAFMHKFVLGRTQPYCNRTLDVTYQNKTSKHNGYRRTDIGQVPQLEQCIQENL